MKLLIPNQQDPHKGCIPACARGVLSSSGRKAPTEDGLIERMKELEGTGFQQLRHALGGCGVHVDIEEPSDLPARLRELCSKGLPVLVALKQSGPAHCVVVERVEAEHVWVHDPNPGEASPKCMPLDDLARQWCGDIAYLPQ